MNRKVILALVATASALTASSALARDRHHGGGHNRGHGGVSINIGHGGGHYGGGYGGYRYVPQPVYYNDPYYDYNDPYYDRRVIYRQRGHHDGYQDYRRDRHHDRRGHRRW